MVNEALFCFLFVPLTCFLLKTLDSYERAVPLWRAHWCSLPDICYEPFSCGLSQTSSKGRVPRSWSFCSCLSHTEWLTRSLGMPGECKTIETFSGISYALWIVLIQCLMEQVRAWGLMTRSISSPVLKRVHISAAFFCGVAYLCDSILIKSKSSWEFLWCFVRSQTIPVWSLY